MSTDKEINSFSYLERAKRIYDKDYRVNEAEILNYPSSLDDAYITSNFNLYKKKEDSNYQLNQVKSNRLKTDQSLGNQMNLLFISVNQSLTDKFVPYKYSLKPIFIDPSSSLNVYEDTYISEQNQLNPLDVSNSPTCNCFMDFCYKSIE